ncbi:MAG: UDP-N-acetylmuramoyl-L-alanine--D-glutamate ligase [bacterium]
MKQQLKGKRIVIVGLGESGRSAARLAGFLGAEITVTDKRSLPELSEERLADLPRETMVFAGGHPEKAFKNCDQVILSPGVPQEIPELDIARKKRIQIVSEVEFACRYIKQPIIAVTGTNGKSTTTTLIGKILADQGFKVFVGANLGNPVSRGVLEMLRRKAAPDYWVLEMSSFQLETVESFHPHIGLFLNLSPDHLDRYRSMEDYRAAKMRLFMNQASHDFAIYNESVSGSVSGRGKKIPFSRKKALKKGCWVENQTVHYAIGSRKGTLGKTAEFGIKGVHNLENVLAAGAAAVTCQAEPEGIRRSLSEFSGLEHRMEFVGKVNGISFINDSKATNLDATEKSLNSFSEPVILIAGGRSKQPGFHELAESIREKVRLLLLIGESAQQIQEDITAEIGNAVETRRADSLAEAVDLGYRNARCGEVVLLSPACASFDAFKNFEDRGRQFKAAVSRLEKN